MFSSQSKEPEVPIYDLLNIKIQSYDFHVLENFSSYIHKTAENMGLEVTEWSVLNFAKSIKRILDHLKNILIVGQFPVKNMKYTTTNQLVCK